MWRGFTCCVLDFSMCAKMVWKAFGVMPRTSWLSGNPSICMVAYAASQLSPHITILGDLAAAWSSGTPEVLARRLSATTRLMLPIHGSDMGAARVL